MNPKESQINNLSRRHYDSGSEAPPCKSCRYGHVIEINDYDKALISCYKKGHTVAIDTLDQPCWSPRQPYTKR